MMGTERLSIPEERVAEVIKVIRAGRKATQKDPSISNETRRCLDTWCDEMDEYINRTGESDDG
jgi:hypothetical protein